MAADQSITTQQPTTHNNQPKIGVCNGGEYGGEVQRVGGAQGKRDTIVWAEIRMTKNIHVKYSIAFGWLLINNGSHNNQTKIGVNNRGKYGEEVQRAGGMWEM